MCFGAPQITMPPPPRVPPPPPAPQESAKLAQPTGEAAKKTSKMGDLLRIPQARNNGTGLNV